MSLRPEAVCLPVSRDSWRLQRALDLVVLTTCTLLVGVVTHLCNIVFDGAAQ